MRTKAKPSKPALHQAVDYLSRQSHSERNLRAKLKQKQYAAEEIDTAIAKVKEYKYLDDEASCKRQFEVLYNESRHSVRHIIVKLQQRGFDKALIKSCIPEDTGERELATALRVLAIKYRKPVEGKKMMSYLYQKGFNYETCRRAVVEYADIDTWDLDE